MMVIAQGRWVMNNSVIVNKYDLKSKHLILFDGVCHLCSGWMQFVYQRDADEMFTFVSVQSAAGQDLYVVNSFFHQPKQ
jgi:predicted DCC family thiol-disulfide oxidoreductase YuxK